MVFREETEVKGIKTYRFRPPNSKTIFDSKDFCFCPTGKNNACYKHGVLSLAPCRDGIIYFIFTKKTCENYIVFKNLIYFMYRCTHCHVFCPFFGCL